MLPTTLTCPEGGSVTCSILRVVEELGSDPGTFQWWASIIIPALSALASVLVLVFSVFTAFSAKEQARKTELARTAAETARSDAAHEEQLRRAFAGIFKAVGEASADWKREAYGPHASPYLSDIHLLGEIAAARLIAKSPEEIRLVDRIRQLVLEIRKKTPEVRSAILAETWRLVISWSGGDRDWREVVFTRFDEIAAMNTLDDAPDWVEKGP